MDSVEVWDTPGASEAAHNIGKLLESLGASKSASMNQAFKCVEQFIREKHLSKPRQIDVINNE